MSESIALNAVEPPGPGFFDSWRRMWDFQHDHLTPVTRLHEEYGAVHRLNLGLSQLYFLNQPELIQECLVARHKDFHKDPYYVFLKLFLGNGLLTSEESFHLSQRRMIQPAFHKQRVLEYGRAMVRHSERTAAAWEDGQHLDINNAMMRLALEIVGETLFSSEVGGEAERVAHALETILGFEARFAQPFGKLFAKLPIPGNRAFFRAIADLDDVLYAMIAEHRKSGDRGDLLSMLLDAQDEEGLAMTDKQLRDEALTLFLAGHETTAIALTWTWYLLGEHPEIEARFHEELDRVLGDRPPTPEDFPALDYTYRVFKESMRLYPPAYMIGRQAIRPTQLGPYAIPKKALVILSPYITQRDAANFPDPLRFDPDRWLPENSTDRHKFAYFPFGGGKRLCIGESFAWMEGVLVMATLGRHWRFRRTDDTPPVLKPSVTLRPRDGMHGTLHRR